MNAKRLSMAFIIALAVSALCTWLLGRKINTHAAVAAELRYVAPAKALQAGEVIKPEDLELVSWPAGNAIAGAYGKVEDLAGRAVLYPIDKDQPITDRFLAIAGSGLGLATKIPEGMRAIALRSDEVMGVAGFIYPQSHLDVLVTYHSATSADPITFTVLQDAEVLAVGQKSQPDPDGKPSTATVVTLLLTPQDAERAVLASSQGTFHFVLRSGSDKTRVNEAPVTLADMSRNWAAPPPVDGHPRPLPVRTAPPPRGFTVETVAGDKSSSETFGGGH
jgi:pilus assembly protein CpaB